LTALGFKLAPSRFFRPRGFRVGFRFRFLDGRGFFNGFLVIYGLFRSGFDGSFFSLRESRMSGGENEQKHRHKFEIQLFLSEKHRLTSFSLNLSGMNVWGKPRLNMKQKTSKLIKKYASKLKKTITFRTVEGQGKKAKVKKAKGKSKKVKTKTEA
jgi:hypothetical protein